ncbi:MAG: HlyD family secretion protein [Prevotellaceae bacterium]|jgi:membrane fusion protein (multidrug efflux system)|nr:HlyD family secretion protein [Prevotellaceae bacterium]
MNKKRKKQIANVIIVALIACGLAWMGSLFIHFGGEYSNNAEVQQDIVPVLSRVQGFIRKVGFDEFQAVKKGDTLVLIEDSELHLRLAQAEADYQNALVGKAALETAITATHNNLSVTDAGIEEVKILLANAEADYQRYKTLLENGATTRQQFDAVSTTCESLRAKVKTMLRQKQSTQLTVDEQQQRLQQSDASIAVCQAAIGLARLNLSYTVIVSPCNGHASRKTIQEGELVMPGKSLLAVVSSEQKWVVANLRETQRRHIEMGSKVEIEVDAFPDATFEGEVAAISSATGAQYSPVSPDHSIGSFVKVEQRIPIKIAFTENNDRELLAKLGAGMNAEIKIRRTKKSAE